MGENGTRHRNRLKVVNKSYDALKATVWGIPDFKNFPENCWGLEHIKSLN